MRDPTWRTTAREEWDRVERTIFPHRRPERVRFVELGPAVDPQWLGRTFADLLAEREGHPSDVLADFVLENDFELGLVAQGIANADVDGVGRTLADPDVLISSSDAGAHLQMICASGDTTLVLTRHVRERGDLTVERAVHEMTGRQAEVFGFRDRGVIAAGAVADLVVFALDELHYDTDGFVERPPRRRPEAAPPRRGLPGDLRRRRRRPGRRGAHRRAPREGDQLTRVSRWPRRRVVSDTRPRALVMKR